MKNGQFAPNNDHFAWKLLQNRLISGLHLQATSKPSNHGLEVFTQNRDFWIKTGQNEPKTTQK